MELILSAPQPGLRTDKDRLWESIVRLSRAEIINRLRTAEMDAYLLSESSLFVWNDRILLITCGQTTPVMAVPAILDHVGEAGVAFFFYERKNVLFPREQPALFEDDVAQLSRYFDGKCLRFGPRERDHVQVYYAANSTRVTSVDVTLQILMHDLDPDVVRGFYDRRRSGQAHRFVKCLEALYPGMQIDRCLFDPPGFSANAVAKDRYCTIHVTPQPAASYASFETNIFDRNCSRVVETVVGLFNPRRFSLLLTASTGPGWRNLQELVAEPLPGYAISCRQDANYDRCFSTTFLNQRRSESEEQRR